MTVMSSVVAVRSVCSVVTPVTSNISSADCMTSSWYSPVTTFVIVFVVSQTTVV